MKKLAAIAATALLAAGCSDKGLPTPAAANPNATLPSQVINLSYWTLTTPLPDPVIGAQEVAQPELATYQSDFFRVSSERNAVIFSTPGNGAVQKGATFPRTELREVLPNGATAAWATTKGTHTLTATASVDSFSKSKTEVVGQVHAVGPYVLLIQLNDHKLFVKAGDKILAVLDDHYKLGRIFKYQFIVTGGTINVFYNDKQVTSWQSDCQQCFFKAGSYLQAPPDPTDTSVGQVSIYSLYVTHSDDNQ